MPQIAVHVVDAPFLNVQVRTALVKISIFEFGNSCLFLFAQRTFVFLYQFCVAWTARSGRSIDRDDDWVRTLDGLDTAIDVAFHGNPFVGFIYIQDLFSVSDLAQS